MAASELVKGVFADTAGENGGNLGAITLPDEVVLVDAGMVHTLSAAVREFLEARTGLKVRKVVFTHSHSDHVFGAQAFPDAQLIGSEDMARQCEENLENRWRITSLQDANTAMKDERPLLWESLKTLVIRIPDITFKDEIRIGPSGEITVTRTGGHTSGSSIVTSDFYGVAFVGDLIFKSQFPYAGDPTCNPDMWIDALEQLTSKDYDFIVPGHGSVCTMDDVKIYVANLKEFRDSIRTGIADGLSSEELVRCHPYPEAWNEGIDRWGTVSVQHWHDFYSR